MLVNFVCGRNGSLKIINLGSYVNTTKPSKYPYLRLYPLLGCNCTHMLLLVVGQIVFFLVTLSHL